MTGICVSRGHRTEMPSLPGLTAEEELSTEPRTTAREAEGKAGTWLWEGGWVLRKRPNPACPQGRQAGGTGGVWVWALFGEAQAGGQRQLPVSPKGLVGMLRRTVLALAKAKDTGEDTQNRHTLGTGRAARSGWSVPQPHLAGGSNLLSVCWVCNMLPNKAPRIIAHSTGEGSSHRPSSPEDPHVAGVLPCTLSNVTWHQREESDT